MTGVVSVLSANEVYCWDIMKRRTLLAIALSALLVVSSPAHGQGKGNGNGPGQNSGSGARENSGSGPGENSGNHQGKGNDGPGPAEANGGGAGPTPPSPPNGPAAPDAPAASPPPAAELPPGPGGPVAATGEEQSESDVLAAVEAGKAVPLSTILPDLRARTGGEVIDANLQQVGSFLLYAVTVLTPAGKVSTEYYYARSGRYVER